MFFVIIIIVVVVIIIIINTIILFSSKLKRNIRYTEVGENLVTLVKLLIWNERIFVLFFSFLYYCYYYYLKQKDTKCRDLRPPKVNR